MLIRFNIELRDSQYESYYNQMLIVLEQFAKLDNFKSKPIREYYKLSIKNTMYLQLKHWIVIETNWSKQITKNLIQGIRSIFIKNNLDQYKFLLYQLIN